MNRCLGSRLPEFVLDPFHLGGTFEMKGRINRLLAKHTKGVREEIEKATAYDHFFSPEESVEFGLCDEIVGFEKILEPIL